MPKLVTYYVTIADDEFDEDEVDHARENLSEDVSGVEYVSMTVEDVDE